MAALLSLGATPHTQDLLRVRELEVVDAAGDVRIRADARSNGPATMEFLDRGLRRIAIAAGLGGEATIQMFDPQDNLRIALTTFPDGEANVLLTDANGETTWSQSNEQDSFTRRLLIMWLPLIVILAVWIFFVSRSTRSRRYRQLIDRTFVHMEALETKLDKVIELLERGPPR